MKEIMNADNIIRLLPLIVFLGVMIWLLRRSRSSYQLQADSVARQKEMTPRLLESIDLQKEGLEIAKKQLEATNKLLEEISALREALKK